MFTFSSMKKFVLLSTLILFCFAFAGSAFAGGLLSRDKNANAIQMISPTAAAYSLCTKSASFDVTNLAIIEVISSADTYMFINGGSPGYLIKANTYLKYAVSGKVTKMVFANASTAAASAPKIYILRH